MTTLTSKIVCPRCEHEFGLGYTYGTCLTCGEPFLIKGNKRYCSHKCRVKARNYRSYQRLKNDPKHRAYKLEYMRKYMRTYRRKVSSDKQP